MQVPCRDRNSQSKLPLDAQWLAQVAYLAHVFEHSNILNVTPQVRGHNIFEQAEKFVSFQNNIALWAGHVFRVSSLTRQMVCYTEPCEKPPWKTGKGQTLSKLLGR